MYKAIINLFYWVVIKSTNSYYGSLFMEVDAAANKIVLFNFRSSIS